MTDLQTLRPLVEMIAAEQTASQPHLYEDAVQEGMIAAWQAIERGKEPGLVRADVRRRALDVARGRSFTGNTRSRGVNGVDTHARYGAPLVRYTDEGEALTVDPEDTTTRRDMYRAELPEVREAVAGLRPEDRDLVELMHWRGYTVSEAGRELGIPQRTLQ